MEDETLQNAEPLESALETELTEGAEAPSTEEAAFDPAEVAGNLPGIIEALLFASDEPLSAQTLKDILRVEMDARKLRALILDMNKKLQADRRPFEIAEIAGGFQFRTIAKYQKYLKGLFKDKAMRRLSGQALETLAIIAYKQPVSKAEIESIRNVNTDSSMKTLLEKRLIKILGKSEEKPGKPIVYGTTRDFLRYFGLNRISDLPKIEEFEEIARSQENTTELIRDFKRDGEKTSTLQHKDDYSVQEESEPAPEPETEIKTETVAEIEAQADDGGPVLPDEPPDELADEQDSQEPQA